MALLRRAEHARRPSRAQRAGHVLSLPTAGCCARTPAPCRSAPWKQPRRPCASSRPAPRIRRDEIDATHLAQFTQMEGLYVAEGVSVADLKGTLESFLPRTLRQRRAVPLPPALLPVHRAELRSRHQVHGKGQPRAGSKSPAAAWSIPPSSKPSTQSAATAHYDPEKFTGFAFGFGLDRLAMILSGSARTSACSSKTTRVSCASWRRNPWFGWPQPDRIVRLASAGGFDCLGFRISAKLWTVMVGTQFPFHARTFTSSRSRSSLRQWVLVSEHCSGRRAGFGSGARCRMRR